MDSNQDLDPTLRDARADLVKFEEALHTAVRGTYYPYFPPDVADDLMKHDPLANIDLVTNFFDQYIACNIYPIERLTPLTYRIMDWKMQAYFVGKALPGMHNALFSRTTFTLSDPMKTPGMYFDHLCLMQSMIAQVRILWERLMSLVYFLEDGREPGKKIRTKFFGTLPAWGGRWDALANCQNQISTYDIDYRNPELHKNSILRASIFKDGATDPNELMRPMEGAIGGFWELLQANISGVRSNIVDVCPCGPIHHPNDSHSDASPPVNTDPC